MVAPQHGWRFANNSQGGVLMNECKVFKKKDQNSLFLWHKCFNAVKNNLENPIIKLYVLKDAHYIFEFFFDNLKQQISFPSMIKQVKEEKNRSCFNHQA